jgi:hypothetical protein
LLTFLTGGADLEVDPVVGRSRDSVSVCFFIGGADLDLVDNALLTGFRNLKAVRSSRGGVLGLPRDLERPLFGGKMVLELVEDCAGTKVTASEKQRK